MAFWSSQPKLFPNRENDPDGPDARDAIHRVFLDWRKPALECGTTWVLDNVGDRLPEQGLLDLQHILCVLPGARAGTLFLAQLLDQCEQRGLSLIPPRVLTPGSMVNELLMPEGAAANEVEIAFARMNALRNAKAASIEALIPSVPQANDLPGWHALATTITGLHAELAGQRLTFANVAAHADRMGYINEGDRWRVLSELHRSYLRTLEEAGIADPHEAREKSLRASASASCDFEGIALIGNVDLNAIQRGAVTTFADRLAVLVFAPPSMADHFDDLGCVKSDRWETHPIALDESQIVRAERPEDQCLAVMQRIASFNGRYAAQEITIGLGDAELSPGLQRAARWAGLFAHDPSGTSLDRSAPARFLEAASDWLSRHRFAEFATLLRHPDVEAAVKRDVGDADGQQ
jgi:hypothetical protein